MNSNSTALRTISTYLGIALCFFVMAQLYGCRSSGTRWEEDRSIPFSPDDRAIAYRHKGAIYVARTQGDKHRQIFDSTFTSIVSSPHWAPGQQAVIFAVSDGNPDPENGLLTYELWYWPAPEEIWISDSEDVTTDTVELPARWRPADPRRILTAQCRDEMQLRADALFTWHPNGEQVLFQDSDKDGTQWVMSFDLEKKERSIASPVQASSLAFSISPDGTRLQVAAKADGPTTLWLGPIGTDQDDWTEIENTPGPRNVPSLLVADAPAEQGTSFLYDLRPRLGAWSPDSSWLAHTRIAESPEEESEITGFDLVITAVGEETSQRTFPMAGEYPKDLHWRTGGERLALLSDNRLLVVDPASSAVDELSAVLGVEQFMGWSKPGDHMAYLILAEEFAQTSALLPTGDLVVWEPAERHNLMIAGADGTQPGSRFSLMNIAAARWGNETEKLSFWATYEPTVTMLPPGDPAAVLDLDVDAIRWYPTDIAEYANVGHYYLLNTQFDDAITHYSDALRKVSDADLEENPSLRTNIRLWRGIARLAAGQALMAENDLGYVRGNVVLPELDEESDWNEDVLRSLIGDRQILSTMISMGQVELAMEEANRIIAEDQDARRIQALCFAALIHVSVGQPALFTDRVILELLPATVSSEQVPGSQADDLADNYRHAVIHPQNLNHLRDSDRMRYGAALAELAEKTRATDPLQANDLLRLAVVFYREAGATEAELELLRLISGS